MTTGGWIFMIGSITAVVSLLSFCFYRVLSKPESKEHMPAPPDIDTRDIGT